MPATILADPLRLKVYETGSDAVAFLRKISSSIDPFVVRTTETQPPGGVIVGVLRTAICASITSFAATPPRSPSRKRLPRWMEKKPPSQSSSETK